jgi:hypothetical protein
MENPLASGEEQRNNEPESPKLKKGRLSNLQNLFIFKHPIFQYKNAFDKSDYPTLINILFQSGKSFLGGYGILAVINLLLSLRNFKNLAKKPKILFQALVNMSNLKGGLFLGSYTLIFKSMIAILRIIRDKDDGKTAFWSGILAGYLSFFFVGAKSRTFFACFLLSRALETLYNHAIIKGYIRKTPFNSWIIYAIFVTGMVNVGYNHPYAMPPSIKKYFYTVTHMNAMDYDLMYLTQEVGRRARFLKSLPC